MSFKEKIIIKGMGLGLAALVSFFIILIPYAHGENLPWVDGTALLHEQSVRLALEYGWGEKMVPGAGILKNKVSSPRLVGDSRTFWAVDFVKSEENQEIIYYQTEAVLEAIGEHSYIYVEKANISKVSNKAIAGLKSGFDEPIYPTTTEVFGDPPDVDGDLHIVILVLDIRDGFSGSGQPFVAGYYDSYNQYPNDTQMGNKVLGNSNETDMFYVDMDPADPASSQTLGTIAHEFQHMIHWNYDPFEDVWLNEGLADLAIFLNGYGHPVSHVDFFLRAPETSLADQFFSGLNEYGAAYLWTLYLWEKYGGDDTITSLVSNKGVGIKGIEETLTSLSISVTFADIFHDWKVANYLDGVSIDKRYGYKNIDLDSFSDLKIVDADGEGEARKINGWGNDYLRFTGPSDIILEGNANLNIRIISNDSSVSDLVWENATATLKVGSGSIILALNPDEASVSGEELAPKSSYSYSTESEGGNPPASQPPDDVFGFFGCGFAGSGGSGMVGPMALGWVGLWGWRFARRKRK